MALLTLVRHGQASFLEPKYDKLSERGELQSRILGEYWVRTKACFDQVYYGPAERHIHTGEIVADVFRAAGAAWPDPIALPEMDEYPGIEVMRTFLPGLMETHEDIRSLEAQCREASDRMAAARVYDRLFQRITRMWVAGELDSPEVESWTHFCERIRGHARAALAVLALSGGTPANTTFVSNELTGFQSSLADVFVDAGVTNTIVIGPKSSVEDHGVGTVVVVVSVR